MATPAKERKPNGTAHPSKSPNRATSWTKWTVGLFVAYWLCVFLDRIKVSAQTDVSLEQALSVILGTVVYTRSHNAT
jgi:hypothetical protein